MDNLDCIGLGCPMPIVKISKAFRKLDEGARIQVLADDSAFRIDLEAWVNKTGHTLVSFELENDIARAVIENTK